MSAKIDATVRAGLEKRLNLIQYPPLSYPLFALFIMNMVIPLLDVPALGISLTAPLFLMIVGDLLIHRIESRLGEYKRWIALFTMIFLGLTLSLVLKQFFANEFAIRGQDLLEILRYAYWNLVGFLTLYLAASGGFNKKVVQIIAISVIALAMIRLGDALFRGTIGSGVDYLVFTQNTYGLLFSSFVPFLFVPVVSGRRTILWLWITFLVLLAVLINGSRASWLSVSVSMLVFFSLYASSRSKKAKPLVILLILCVLLAGALVILPDTVVSYLDARLNFIQDVQKDESSALRILLVQKGLRLFQRNPLLGVGFGRFTEYEVAIDIPREMQYITASTVDSTSEHNSYIQILAETGLMGTAPYLFLLLILFLAGFNSALELSRRGEIWALGIFVALIGMSVHFWFITGLRNTHPWVIYGLTASIIQTAKQYRQMSKE